MAQIKLLSLPSLDNTYQNVIDFASLAEQSNWFDNKIGRIVEGNIKTDTEQEQLTLNIAYHLVKPYDYLYFNDTNGKRLYYFITSKSIKTSDTTIVDIECDVWNTYLFDYDLMDSYVDRCHVKRWSGDVPTVEVVDEGLPIGEYITDKVAGEKLRDYHLGGYLITSSTPLGKTRLSGGTGGPGGDITKGIPSAKGYRFVKGYEGFAPEPGYFNGEDFRTAGYGITELYKPQWFDKMKPFPCSEQTAAMVYGDMLIADFGLPLANRMKEDGVDLSTVRINQFDAFCSLAMNGGLGAVTDSPMYERFIVNPNDPQIPSLWLGWYTNGGLAGLVARRKAEADIYSKSVYEFRSIGIFNPSGAIVGTVTDNDGHGFIPPIFGSLDGDSLNLLKITNAYGMFTCPTTGTVTASYPTYPEGGVHNGVDIANAIGTPIYAMRDGTVTISGPVNGYGNAIYIDHGDSIMTIYGHMYAEQLLVKAGDRVKEGQQIASIGNAGISTGPHLHFEVRRNSVPTHPAPELTVGQVIK